MKRVIVFVLMCLVLVASTAQAQCVAVEDTFKGKKIKVRYDKKNSNTDISE